MNVVNEAQDERSPICHYLVLDHGRMQGLNLGSAARIAGHVDELKLLEAGKKTEKLFRLLDRLGTLPRGMTTPIGAEANQNARKHHHRSLVGRTVSRESRRGKVPQRPIRNTTLLPGKEALELLNNIVISFKRRIVVRSLSGNTGRPPKLGRAMVV